MTIPNAIRDGNAANMTANGDTQWTKVSKDYSDIFFWGVFDSCTVKFQISPDGKEAFDLFTKTSKGVEPGVRLARGTFCRFSVSSAGASTNVSAAIT